MSNLKIKFKKKSTYDSIKTNKAGINLTKEVQDVHWKPNNFVERNEDIGKWKGILLFKDF